MTEHVWMTALETAEYIRLNFRKGSKVRSRMVAFREFLNSPRAYGFPEPSIRMDPKRPLWNRALVDKWLTDPKANKEAKAKWSENENHLIVGAAKYSMYRKENPEDFED